MPAAVMTDLGGPAPRFTALWPEAGGLALFAELAQFLVALPDAHLLRPQAAAARAAAGPRRLDELRGHLRQLAAQGLWRLPPSRGASGGDDEVGEHAREDGDGDYLLPDFSAPPRRLAPQWLSLADARQDALALELAARCPLPDEVTAVVADDPLDPRLGARLDPRLELLPSQRERRPWILVRLSGEHPMVGPRFGAPEAACWSCLAFRLLWNQPVRRWFHRAHPGPLAAIPVAWRPRQIAPHLPRVAAALRALLDEPPGASGLLELSWQRPELRRHPALRRPQCAACGDPARYAATAAAPIALSAVPRAWDEDGGFRAERADDTARALEAIVSPVSGLVAGVTCQSRPEPEVNQVFRAWFGKTSYAPGLPRTDQLFQTTMGKGVLAVQSRVSAIAEALERLASSYHGDEPRRRARARELPGRSIAPGALAPYSAGQYRAFAAAAAPALHAMLPCGDDDVLDWTPVWSLTRDEPCFVPFTWCYTNTPFDQDRRCRFFHNGGAAGTCLEEAILQGWLELVERDAVAVWWYNRLRRPAMQAGPLPDELTRQLAATLGDHEVWLLDVTHDLGVPVCVAVSRHRATGKLCLGFGCHLDAQLAVRRAVTELCQIHEIRERHSAPFDFDAITAEEFLFPDASARPAPRSLGRGEDASDLAEDVRRCVRRARELELEVLVLDYSRPEFPLRTAKVIMPGACHIFPYRGARRLYDVPVRMGWRRAPLGEAELNPLELLI